MVKEKKHLVIATDNFLPRWDGIARFLIEIITRLKKDYKITVLTSDFKGNYSPHGFDVVRFPLRKFYIGDFPPSKPNKKLIKKVVKTADIVWVQTIGPIGSASIKIAKKQKKKLVAYNHSIEWELVPNAISKQLVMKPLYYLTKIIAKKLYNNCDELFVPSQEVSDKLARHGIKRNKIIISLGVDSEEFMPTAKKVEAKKKVKINPKNFVIGYVGRIAREKDLKTLFRAYVRFKKYNKHCVLLIVGDGVDEIKKLLLSRKDVVITGKQDKVTKYYHAMDVYCLPSLTETTSLTTLEAMSCELPVIVTKTGAMKDYIKNNQNGFLVDKKDPYSFYRKIMDLYENPKLAFKLGKKARETVIKDFSWDNTVDKIREELSKLLNL